MSNASGSLSGESAETWDSVDSGQSEDIENSLPGQGVSDRATADDIHEHDAEGDDAARIVRPGGEERD